jgi:serine/threonine protein kinase
MDNVPHVRFPPNTAPFEHKRPLGRGGFAAVDEVIPASDYVDGLGHTDRNRTYARKVLRVSRRQPLDEILGEIRVMKTLRHRHIVEVKMTYEEPPKGSWDPKTFGIVMHPVADCSLKDYLYNFSESWLNASSAAERLLRANFAKIGRWFGCLASGLAFIHANHIRHKDIKPANILVWKDSVLYTDFGISRPVDELNTKTTGDPGPRTEMYCPPEVANSMPRGRKADVFSLGCVYAEMLTVYCGYDLQSFANFRGPYGAQAYYLNLDKTLRWLFELQPMAAGYHHYCAAALIPDPDLRLSSEDMKCWISCDRDCLPGWHKTRACSCLGADPVGEFWVASLECDPPYQSAMDEAVDISWESAINSWILRTKWNQTSRDKVPDLIEKHPPKQKPEFSFDAKTFFTEADNAPRKSRQSLWA